MTHRKINQKTLSASRIAAISDGVFAIAMTLLVLDIQVPQFADSVTKPDFAAALLEEVPSFIGWLISFAILYRLWVTHHSLLEGGGTRSRAFAGVNFIFLGAIAFIPFPTALMSEHPNQALAVIIFSANYGIASLALGGLWYLLTERAADGSHRPAHVGPIAKHVIIMMPATALLASLLALINPTWGVATWLLLPFVFLAWRIKSASLPSVESPPPADVEKNR